MHRTLAATYSRDHFCERVCYALGELPDGTAPRPVELTVNWETISGRLATLAATVAAITDIACLPPEERVERPSVERDARALALTLLPYAGLPGLYDPSLPLELHADEKLSSIPWEMLEEEYYGCVRSAAHYEVIPCLHHKPPSFCRDDGAGMSLVRRKLGISRTLPFKVKPAEPPAPEIGSRFLVVLDPQEDLLSKRTDPDGVCGRMHKELVGLLEDRFELVLLRGPSATAGSILTEIANPDLAGIYYFGHGGAADGKNDGWFAASDHPVRSTEIRMAESKAKVVFINACLGGATPAGWFKELRFGSVAHAFAEGARKSVIGAVWPVVSYQAARAAQTFFRTLLAEAESVETSLRRLREESLELYLAGGPDTVWMSFRIFGEPAFRFAGDQKTHGDPPGEGHEEIDPAGFSFDIMAVLGRAARRRNLQERSLVSLEDFVAGLLRRGDLLRFVCQRAGRNPDVLYQNLLHRDLGPVEPEGLSLPDVSEPEAWSIGSYAELEPTLADILDAARRAAPSGQVSEQGILNLLFVSSGPGVDWLTRLRGHLPSGTVAEGQLRRSVGTLVDEDGSLLLVGLSPEARRIIEEAHELSGQRGLAYIPNRLFLAAFLSRAEGVAALAIASVGGLPDRLRKRLIESTQGSTPHEFALSFSACSRIVYPVLREAERIRKAIRREEIDDEVLFHAYSRMADPRLKKWLLGYRPPVDLEKLSRVRTGPTDHGGPGGNGSGGGGDSDDKAERRAPGPEALGSEIRALCDEASRLASLQGLDTVSTPHLFAAMVGDSAGPAAEALRERKASIHAVKLSSLGLLAETRRRIEKPDVPSFSKHCVAVLRLTVELAAAEGRGEPTSRDLFEAFFSDGGGVVGRLLLDRGFGSFP